LGTAQRPTFLGLVRFEHFYWERVIFRDVLESCRTSLISAPPRGTIPSVRDVSGPCALLGESGIRRARIPRCLPSNASAGRFPRSRPINEAASVGGIVMFARRGRAPGSKRLFVIVGADDSAGRSIHEVYLTTSVAPYGVISVLVDLGAIVRDPALYANAHIRAAKENRCHVGVVAFFPTSRLR